MTKNLLLCGNYTQKHMNQFVFNWKYITYYVQYKALNVGEKYPYKELTFTCVDQWAADGSGIKLKKLPFPFKAGEKTFYLEKDPTCVYKSYFKIKTYSH